MKLIRELYNLRCQHRPSVVTIGNFDGLHLGHRAVLAQLKKQAEAHQLPATVMIFEPQPQRFFLGDQAPMRIMSFRQKVDALSRFGVDQLLSIRFDQSFAHYTAQDFIEKILHQGLGVRHLVIGDDFQFGQGREGDFQLLEQQGQRLGFSVEQAATYQQGGERVSSTRIRTLLTAGDIEQANDLLGEPFRITGRVEHGLQLGRQLNVPTANITLNDDRLPLRGVYIVSVELPAGTYHGVANIGLRPTVRAAYQAHQTNSPASPSNPTASAQATAMSPRLEAHLFDYSGDLYGERITVKLLHKLREEQKFDSLEALKTAIQQDIQQANVWIKSR